jgi:hypothetical protein
MSASFKHERFVWSDAWILLAIIYASRPIPPATLEEIIAAGDYINHSIFTRGELETGLTRLIDAGHVTRDASGFLLAEAVRSFWDSAASQKRFVMDALDAVRIFIGAPEWKHGPLPETDAQQYVTEAAYTGAVEAYQQRTRKYTKLKPKGKKRDI